MKLSGLAINADASVLDGSLPVLRRELDHFQQIGFTHVELAPHGAGAIYGGRLIRKRSAQVRALLDEYPFGYTVHGPNPLNLMSGDRLDEDGFLASLEFTALIGAKIMVYHAGRYLPEELFALNPKPYPDVSERRKMWDRECTLLQKMGEAAKQFDVVIAVENARPYLDAPDYCYGESLLELGRMIREVQHPRVGVTLDTGHAYLAARRYGFDLTAGVAALAPYIRHIHLHDNFGRCSTSQERKQYEMAVTGRGDMHMPVGWGEVPVEDIFSQLPDYRGVVTLEVRPRYREYYLETLRYAERILSQYEAATAFAPVG